MTHFARGSSIDLTDNWQVTKITDNTNVEAELKSSNPDVSKENSNSPVSLTSFNLAGTYTIEKWSTDTAVLKDNDGVSVSVPRADLLQSGATTPRASIPRPNEAYG